MSVDLAQALQDFSSAVDFMRRNAQQLWDVYLNPTPKTIAIYGPDGNIVGNIPNHSLFKQQVWSDIRTGLSKSFVVSSADELYNAIVNETPPSGFAVITLQNDIELDRDIPITQGKTILITGYSDAHKKISFVPVEQNSSYRYFQLSLGYNSNLRFHYVDFEFQTYSGSLDPAIDPPIRGTYAQNSSVVLGACKVTLDKFPLILGNPYGTPLQIGLYYTEITTNGQYLIENRYRPVILLTSGITIDDTTKLVADENYVIS